MEENLKKEMIEEINKLKERFISDKTTSENFTDEQIGMIKCWLEQAYALGKENAKNGFFGMLGGGNDELNLWQNMVMFERNINALLSSEVSTLLYSIDKEKFGMAFGCTKI